MEEPLKRKVVKVSGYTANIRSRSKSPVRPPISRPASPTKISGQASLSPQLSRPRAQINSSARIARKPSGSSSVAGSSRTLPITSPPPIPPVPRSRPTSPFKPNPLRVNANLTPAAAPVKARVTAKSNSSVSSTPASPESRQRALTAASSEAARFNRDRRRSGSFSLQRTYSSASLSTSVTPASPVQSSPSQSPTKDPSIFPSTGGLRLLKAKSKVSGLAKSNGQSPTSLSPSPSLPSSPLPSSPSVRPARTHTRVASIASISSSNYVLGSNPSSPPPDPQIFPITTAVRSASPYRFATSRNSPPYNNNHSYRPFLPNGVDNNRPTPVKLDPSSIPLPPLSPPTSAVSFSSQSSLSVNSIVSAGRSPQSFSTLGSQINPRGLKLTPGSIARTISEASSLPSVDTLPRTSSPQRQTDTDDDEDTSGDSGGSQHKVKAEAKSIRKIADLEITNRSLLAINSSLETTKHRQAKEIRDLRRKLRESRLILPPRAFQAVKSSLDHDDTASEEDEEDEDDDVVLKNGTQDEVYKRVKVIIDGMIETGKRALEYIPENLGEGLRGGAKVLHAEEVRLWRRDSGGGATVGGPDDSFLGPEDSLIGPDDSMTSSRAMSPVQMFFEGDSSIISSEGQVEALTSFILNSPPPGTVPPITITHS